MEECLVTKSRLAAADLSDYQFHAVKITAANTVGICTTDGEMAYGILQDTPSVAGQAASVAVRGTTKAIAGAVVTVGAQVMTDANGHLIDWTAGATKFPLGTALTAAAAAGVIFSVDLDARSCKVS